MKNNLIFGGVNTADYGIWITGMDTFTAPSRAVEYVSIPGRNGDLLVDHDKWNNVTLTYPAFIPSEFSDRMDAFRSAICRKVGYQRLEDSYHPDEYRLASFDSGMITNRTAPFNRAGNFDLTFNCKPQRFLKSGTKPIQLLIPEDRFITGYIPVNDNSIWIEYNASDGVQRTVSIITYDDQKAEITRTNLTCNDGDAQTVSLDQATEKYVRVKVTGTGNLFKLVKVKVRTKSSYNGDDLYIDALMTRYYSMKNPTGYPTKPLFDIYSEAFPGIYIGSNSNEYDYYIRFGSQAYMDVNRVFVDCELQYVYGDDGSNLTNRLFMTAEEVSDGLSKVFPMFGGGNIELQLTMNAEDTALSLVNVYPYWWRL